MANVIKQLIFLSRSQTFFRKIEKNSIANYGD